MSPALLASAIIALALGVLLFPVPSSLQQARATRAAVSANPVGVTGNSVITHRSKCDADARTLPQMMGAADLSFPGQTLAEGLNIAGFGAARAGKRDLVMLVSLSQLTTVRREDARSMAFFRAAGTPLPVNAFGGRITSFEPITAGPEEHQTAFAYRGVNYPAYDQLKNRYLLPERLAQSCPETRGKNLRFIEALYWNNYLRFPPRPDYWQDIAALAAEAARHGGRVTVALMPVDYEDIGALNPAVAAELRARVGQARRQAATAGVSVLDLTEGVPAAGFADRWCGCGHLSDVGRRHVADTVTRTIAGRR